MIVQGSYPSRCFISMLAISVASRKFMNSFSFETQAVSVISSSPFVRVFFSLFIHHFAVKSLIRCSCLLLQSVSSVVALIHVFHYFIRVVFDRSHDGLLRVQHGLPSVSFILRAYRFYASHTSNPCGGLRSKRISTSEQCRPSSRRS